MSEAAEKSIVLEVKDLAVSLPPGGDRPNAVEGVSFTVRAGEVTCLIGESGSGKSVIASTVMGLLPKGLKPVKGSVRLMGQELLGKTHEQIRKLRGERMAMVFQEPMTALNPVMTCGDQLDEMLKAHVDMLPYDRRTRILDILEQVRLPDPPRIYRSYPHQLSGGQRQRIVIAMALILKPDLLICDEPTTALDVTTQASILKLILELQQKNDTAVLFITHDFGVVSEIANQVVVLELGHQIETGSAEEVLQHPQEPYTQMLINAVPELKPRTRPPVDRSKKLIEANNIVKTYTMGGFFTGYVKVEALKGVSVSLSRGQTIGIVGESGSGKSTFARCIARLIDPTAGEIIVDGGDIAHLPRRHLHSYRRKVQVVFQDPYRSLDPRMTVGESIIEGPVNFGVPREKAWKRAEELMGLIRLSPDVLSRYPNQFSGGQRQRISIARALACEPEVIIADEAVSALDVSVQADILKLLEDIQKQLGIGILFVTHDLRVASQICDEVIVISKGTAVETGPVNEVFFNPKDAYTQSLIAAAPGKQYPFGRTAHLF
ncbi:ABC transporter ATP-binding protein [Sutterella sp.]|uniref:dipeptide ABC transporter ATP-binding protein n=1 Tax=Sutterella sp. TaxID=1981025 RepID=UPI0026DEAB93|nr:ABC transporter ATP-binding protein [Sutterella sp.]MDO5532062.1 ABC transporter ATP-binding protein [Sutterella sp.]